jgi:hypothetical protein
MFLPFLRLRTAWFADVRVASQFVSQLRACLFAFADETPELVNFVLSARRVSVRRLFMLLTYLFRICFGVRCLPVRARERVTAVRRASRRARVKPVRSLTVTSGSGSRRRVDDEGAAAPGEGLRTEVGLFELERAALLIAF